MARIDRGWYPLIAPLASALLAACGCAEATIGPSPPSESAGETVDLGPIIIAGPRPIAHTFRVRNPFAVPVTIESETHSCACTGVTLSEHGTGAVVTLPHRLGPGAELELAMRVEAVGNGASRSFESDLLTDHPDQPTWAYSLRVETFSQAAIVPPRVDLGDLRDDGSPWDDLSTAPALRTTRIDLYVDDTSAIPEPRIARQPEELTVSIGQTPEIESISGRIRRVRYPITLGIVPGAIVGGPFERSVTLETEGLDEPVSCTVAGNIRGPFVIEPPRLHFGMVTKEDAIQHRQLILRATEGVPFRILDVTIETRGPESLSILSEIPTPSTTQHQLNIRLDASAVDRVALAGEIVVQTDQNANATARIPWAAFVRRENTDSPAVSNLDPQESQP